MAHSLYTTRAIIIKSNSLGEADRSFFLLTEDLGLIRVFGKGIRYEKSKLNSSLQDLGFSRVTLVRGKNFWKITSASEIYNFFRLNRNEKEKIAVLMRVLNLLCQLVQGEEKNSGLFRIAKEGADFLAKEELSQKEIAIFELIFVLKILHNLGYIAPRLLYTEILSTPWKRARVIGAKIKNLIVNDINKALKESHL